MAKSDAPAFQMTVENGRLSPATAFDQERLLTWRNGSKVRVRFVEENDRIGIRKWWAIINRAVKDANTPWDKAAPASEAIKLALGIVNLGKTASGAWMQYPRSLTELDDPELDDAVRDMMALLHKLTGIDPAEWRKEAADVGRDEQQSLDGTAPSGDGSGEASPCNDPAPTETAAADPAPGKTAPPPEDSSGVDKLSDDDREFLVRVFTTMKAAVGPDVGILKRQASIFKEEIAGKSTLVKAKATKIRTELEKCCSEKPAVGTVEIGKYLASLIGVDERELA